MFILRTWKSKETYKLITCNYTHGKLLSQYEERVFTVYFAGEVGIRRVSECFGFSVTY